MNYKQTLEYMYERLPMFHRMGSAAYKANLDNTVALCGLLGNPQEKFRSIHVAGTNGKGSTSHMLASVLQGAGYRVGLYTSPHLKDFRERIRINGIMIPRKFVSEFVSTHKIDFERIHPSFFEMTVGLAFDYFARKSVDIAVIETGLGGRLDSTNVIRPVLSVITNISFDHQHLLGNTLEKIAGEKAGIIKPGIPVVIGETQKQIRAVFMEKARKGRSDIYFADKYYSLRKRGNTGNTGKKGKLFLIADVYRGSALFIKNLHCQLPADYQRKNCATVLMGAELLNRLGYRLSRAQVISGIKNVINRTGLKGRWQVLNRKPLTVVDTGHNEAGIKEVLKQVKHTPHRKLHFVLGIVNDKDISGILGLLPKRAVYYFCKAKIPRALDPGLLMQQARVEGLKGAVFPSVKRALKAAQDNAGKSDLILVGGSTFVVGEVLV